MREITSHKIDDIKGYEDRQPALLALGHPTIAGAEQDYQIIYAEPDGTDHITEINFVSLEEQGVTNEALLAIVIDRLEGFQSGEFPCQENQLAMNACRYALSHLKQRTRGRIARGVENQAKA